jgi:hypothetical protein
MPAVSVAQCVSKWCCCANLSRCISSNSSCNLKTTSVSVAVAVGYALLLVFFCCFDCIKISVYSFVVHEGKVIRFGRNNEYRPRSDKVKATAYLSCFSALYTPKRSYFGEDEPIDIALSCCVCSLLCGAYRRNFLLIGFKNNAECVTLCVVLMYKFCIGCGCYDRILLVCWF